MGSFFVCCGIVFSMNEVQPKNFGIFLIAVFLVSMTVLCYEVALAFEFAFMFWFYLSFIVIAVAMFGIGVGSVLGYFIREKYPDSFFDILGYSAMGIGLGMILSILIAATASRLIITFDFIGAFVLFVGLILSSAMVPFVFSGIFLSVSLNYPTSEKRFISFIYFADLVGAGIGAFLISALLPYSSVEEVTLLCGFLAILASLIFVEKIRMKHIRFLAISVFLIFGTSYFGAVSPEPVGGKFLGDAKESGARVLDTRWTSVSRVDVIEYESGLKRFVENAEYPITISEGLIDSGVKSDPRFAMFYRNPESMLAIGSGGGVELAMALSEGVEKIEAAEINPFIVDYMKSNMAEYSNYLYFDPRIDVVVEDGRTYVHRSKSEYDLIENGVIGSAGLVVPSTAMLTTKDVSVYTVEANQEYVRHLSEEGVLVTIIYSLLDDFNTIDREKGITAVLLKQFSTVSAALEKEGLDSKRHFAMFRFIQEEGDIQDNAAQAEYTFVFKSALEKDDALELISAAERYGLEALYVPFYEESLNLDSVILGLSENKDVSPATDDRPFFYFTDRSYGLILIGAIGLILLLTFLFIILPIVRFKHMDFRGENMGFLIFFLAIGIGYILIEATLIQKFILFLGRPSYAFQVVLFSMLIFSGLGSMASGSLIKKEKEVTITLILMLSLISLIILIYSFSIQGFIQGYIHLKVLPKIISTIVVISLPAFIMGMPFPLGLRLVSRRAPPNVIWMYGINSSGSVLASILGMYMALLHGFSKSLFLGGLMYGVAIIAILSVARMGK
jgi:hypothetical protein